MKSKLFTGTMIVVAIVVVALGGLMLVGGS